MMLLSLNNSRFGDFVDRIYSIEFEIKNTTDTDRFASYIDLHLEIDSRVICDRYSLTVNQVKVLTVKFSK
jgi:hypothetical protein